MPGRSKGLRWSTRSLHEAASPGQRCYCFYSFLRLFLEGWWLFLHYGEGAVLAECPDGPLLLRLAGVHCVFKLLTREHAVLVDVGLVKVLCHPAKTGRFLAGDFVVFVGVDITERTF